MTITHDTPTTTTLLYRFEAQLGELNPIGIFPEGIRFHNSFEGHVVDGPLTGSRVVGVDEFLLRPDGVGVIDAPEVIETPDGGRFSGRVLGYVVPPAGLAMPPLEAVVTPGFAFPDEPFRVTAAVLGRTTISDIEWVNHTTVVVEGTVNLATGRLEIEAGAVPDPARR